MRWHLSWRADPQGKRIADAHYNRQNPDSDQFVPPGRCVVLIMPGVALWVTSWPKPEYVKHAWAGAWVNSLFRNERGREHRSSELITEAIAATRFYWPDVPDLGLVTFVDETKVAHKRDPGRCYRKAGFVLVGRTKEENLLAWQLLPERMPQPEAPLGAQHDLFAGGTS